MTFFELPLLFADFFDFLDSPQWRAWPFNSGFGEHILPAIARLLFVTAIMGAILLFLRLLFGPGGPLRDKELEREAEEEFAKEKAKLDKQLADGDISDADYKILLKKLK